MAALTIGGSEAAAACGVDPYRSRIALWLEKTGKVEPKDGNEAMRWGNLLEALIRAEVQVRNASWRAEIVSDALLDPERPWMVGHLDGLLTFDDGAKAVLEIKTASLRKLAAWREADIPPAYVMQAHQYMHLSGLDRTVFACLVGGQELITCHCDRDDELIALLLEREADFVRLVETDTPPEPDGSASADEMIARLYPFAAGGVVHLEPADAELVEQLKTLKAAAKETERQADEIAQKLKLKLGDSAVGMLDGQILCRWPQVVGKRFSVGDFKEEHPALYTEYLRESSYRRFKT